MAPEFLGHPGVRIGILAQRMLSRRAEEAVAAGDRKWIDDAIAHFQVLHAAADFHHFAHEFVADDIAAHHGRDVTVVDVQIRSTDRRGGDADDRIAWVENLRVRDFLDAQIRNAVPTIRLHSGFP